MKNTLILTCLITLTILLAGCGKPLEEKLAGKWQGTDALGAKLEFSKGGGFTITVFAPSSLSGGAGVPLSSSGMWVKTGRNTFSVREGGEESDGEIDGSGLILTKHGGLSSHFQKIGSANNY